MPEKKEEIAAIESKLKEVIANCENERQLMIVRLTIVSLLATLKAGTQETFATLIGEFMEQQLVALQSAKPPLN